MTIDALQRNNAVSCRAYRFVASNDYTREPEPVTEFPTLQ